MPRGLEGLSAQFVRDGTHSGLYLHCICQKNEVHYSAQEFSTSTSRCDFQEDSGVLKSASVRTIELTYLIFLENHDTQFKSSVRFTTCTKYCPG